MDLTNIQLSKKNKILIVIFCALIVFADVSFILKAQRIGLRKLNPKIAKLKKDLVGLNRGLESMRLAKDKAVVPGQKKALGPSRILSEGKISELLQEIAKTANKFDIQISQMRPSRPTQKEKPAAGLNKLAPMLINLDLVSDYHNLGKFIQALENASIFMQVQEMDISTQLPDYMKQKITLVLKTYVAK